MQHDAIEYRPIGVIRSEHRDPARTPIQSVFAKGCKGTAEIRPEFVDGLRDVDGYSHIYLIYHFHKVGPAQLIVKPFLQDVDRGLFSTRKPCRPNPIGLSVVELVRVEGNVLYMDGVDVLDGTPLLDIKPYAKRFDCFPDVRSGWHHEVDDETARNRGELHQAENPET